MQNSWIRIYSRLLIVIAAVGAGPAVAIESIAPAPAGQVRFYNVADSDFDVYSKNPDEQEKAWMRAHYFRMQTYSTYFDSRLSWFPNAWAYKDSYAIKPEWKEFKEHPEWVLRDAQGRMLFIPWGCANGRCPQYAGDVGNPEFRAHWIARARILMEKGYAGLWIDDVNLAWRVGDGDGQHVKPIDPRTGAPMTFPDWRRYFAEFMEDIRRALPEAEIAHNSIWYAASTDDIYVRRQIDAADYINLERGATDKGLRGGAGRFGLETFFGFVDFVHSRGRSVIMMDYGKSHVEREYGLAAWFLVSAGKDMMSSSRLHWTAPDSFWPGYEMSLGTATGPRYKWRGLLRRDFDCGIVLLNQPGARRAQVTLPAGLSNLNGSTVSAATLGASHALVLTRRCD